MTAPTVQEDRLLTVPEREMVAQTRPPAVDMLTKEEIQLLGKRLREARDRSRRIASQQQREMRGKSDPRGVVPARDNAGSESKTGWEHPLDQPMTGPCPKALADSAPLCAPSTAQPA